MKLDHIIAMNVLALGVLSAGYGAQVMSEIPSMTRALNNPKKLVPMPEVIEFCNETISDTEGNDLCVDGDEYAPIAPELYLPRVVAVKGGK